jgi:hypothetical protein
LWHGSHSIAGYFEHQVEAEPRLGTGDKMVAEWRKTEIETARERSGKRSREPHPMADYQVALPPFFPKGFEDINEDDVEGERRPREEAQKLLEPECMRWMLGMGLRGMIDDNEIWDFMLGRLYLCGDIHLAIWERRGG